MKIGNRRKVLQALTAAPGLTREDILSLEAPLSVRW